MSVLLQMATPTHVWEVLIGHSIIVTAIKKKTPSRKEHILEDPVIGRREVQVDRITLH